jgi:hypothetical protein
MIEAAAEIFLKSLFARSQANRFVTSLANDKGDFQRLPPRQIVTRDVKLICEFAGKWDRPGRALFVCVATLLPGHTRRAKANLSQLVCLHADLDFKGIAAPRDDIERALLHLPCRPNIVVASGHGLHGYWLLEEAVVATTKNIARIEWLLRKLANLVAGDPMVCECARLMRLPGSHNSKNGEWLKVTVIEWHKGHYALAQLEHWLSNAAVVLPRVEPPKRIQFRDLGSESDSFAQLAGEQYISAPVDIEARLAEMQHHGPGETGLHNTQLSVTAALLRRGWPVDDVVAHVLKATIEAVGAEGIGWDWCITERELRGMCRSWLVKHPRVVCSEEVFDRVTTPCSSGE